MKKFINNLKEILQILFIKLKWSFGFKKLLDDENLHIQITLKTTIFAIEDLVRYFENSKIDKDQLITDLVFIQELIIMNKYKECYHTQLSIFEIFIIEFIDIIITYDVVPIYHTVETTRKIETIMLKIVEAIKNDNYLNEKELKEILQKLKKGECNESIKRNKRFTRK